MKFDSYHPTLNFVFFAFVIACTIWWNHPVFLGISWISASLYAAWLNGKKAVLFHLALLPCVAAASAWYACYNHFGVTSLAVNAIGNQITLESLLYGLVLSLTVAAVLMWFSCVHAIISTDKVVYLFGRVSPRLSLYFSILLRMVPHIKEKAHKIHVARQGMGRGFNQGPPWNRLRNVVRICSIVLTWTIENLIETAASMKSRGYSLRGRTAFSIFRFDYRDRTLVIAMFSCMIVLLMGVLLDQTHILYNPEVVFNRITPLSYVFYIAYAFLCLLPLLLQAVGEHRMNRNRMNRK